MKLNLTEHSVPMHGDYTFMDINADGPSQLRRLLVSADGESFDLFCWANGWVYDDNVGRETAVQMLQEALEVYQRVIT